MASTIRTKFTLRLGGGQRRRVLSRQQRRECMRGSDHDHSAGESRAGPRLQLSFLPVSPLYPYLASLSCCLVLFSLKLERVQLYPGRINTVNSGFYGYLTTRLYI